MASKQFVAYYTMSPRAKHKTFTFSTTVSEIQEASVAKFLSANEGVLFESILEQRQATRVRKRWPELKRAVNLCLETGADLIIGEVRNLPANPAFAKEILRLVETDRSTLRGSNILDQTKRYCNIICCDKDYISRKNFAAVSQHAIEDSLFKSRQIKEGLMSAGCPLGSPKADIALKMMNLPKSQNSIYFALLLKPIISQYLSAGLTQREMVATLNGENKQDHGMVFTPPEGGKWCLSQLQKMIIKININDAALNLEHDFIEYNKDGKSIREIVSILNTKRGPTPPCGKSWTEAHVEDVTNRIKQIHDLIGFNEFILEMAPLLDIGNIDAITGDSLQHLLLNANVALPEGMQANG